MKITVHLHTILQRQTREGLVGRLEVSLPAESSVNDLLDHLDVELAPENLLLVVNGRMAELTQALHDGDEVNLMPAISGGRPTSLKWRSTYDKLRRYGAD